jgi:ribonuclease HI
MKRIPTAPPLPPGEKGRVSARGVPVTTERPVVVYSDGACAGNPGAGGWAAIIIDDGPEREISGGELSTTNQRMELRAALEGLRAVNGRREVDLYSDSAYLVNCFRDRWYLRWRQNGWRNAQKRPVENRDLWEALLAENERHTVRWHKVAGHRGDPLNERADRLAVAAIARPSFEATSGRK